MNMTPFLKRILLVGVLCVFSGMWQQMSAVTEVGADNAVSRQSQQTLDANTDTAINTFAYMERGFAFTDHTSTASFYSIFPVKGLVYLHSGRLFLNNDLYFSGTGQFQLTGTVVTQSLNTVHLTTTDHTETSSLLWDIDGGGLHLHSWTSLSSSWTFSGANIVINGHGNTLHFDPDGFIEVEEGCSVIFRDIVFTNVKGGPGTTDRGYGNIMARGAAAAVTFDNCDMYLGGDYTYTGRFFVENQFRVFGKDHKFTYSAANNRDAASQVKSGGKLYFDRDVTFSYDAGAVDLLTFVDSNAFLHFNGATFHASVIGADISGGTILLENDVTFEGPKDDQSGTGGLHEIKISDADDTYILGGATLDVNGFIHYSA